MVEQWRSVAPFSISDFARFPMGGSIQGFAYSAPDGAAWQRRHPKKMNK